MSEGTKLGSLKDNQDFNPVIKEEESKGNDDSLKGTKIGEVSDFEKGLLSDLNPSEENKNPEVSKDELSEQPAKKSSISAEINESFLDADYENQLTDTVMDYQENDIIRGVVRKLEKGGAFVDIRYKSDGFIPAQELFFEGEEDSAETIKPGDEIDVFITKLESKEGYTVLSKKRADYELAWSKLAKLVKTKETIDVAVSSKVQGGLVASFSGIRGFIPASQVLNNTEDDLEGYVGQTVTVTVIQADRKRRKVIFSSKAVKAATREVDQKIFDDLDIGQVREGKVTSIKEFGSFVDLGGVEGLIHISEISWARVNHPSEKMAVGDTVKVFVLGIDKENKRVSLGMKQLEPDPWVSVAKKYKVDDVVTGVVTRIVPFGAFVKIEDNLEGLIHISELSYNHVNKVEEVVSVGSEVKAVVIKLIPDEQKIGLSLKGVENAGKRSEEASVESDAATESEQAAAQEDAPAPSEDPSESESQ